MYADCRFTIYFRISQNQSGRIFAGAFHQSLQLSWNLSMEFKTVRTRIRNEYQCPWISRIKACYTQNENEGCDHGAGRLSFLGCLPASFLVFLELRCAANRLPRLHTIGHLCQLSALYRAHNGGHCADQHKQVQFQKAPHVCPTFNNLLIDEIRNCPVGIQQTGLKILGHGDCPIQPVSPHRSSPASARSQ